MQEQAASSSCFLSYFQANESRAPLWSSMVLLASDSRKKLNQQSGSVPELAWLGPEEGFREDLD
jgi:hypothetical protein